MPETLSHRSSHIALTTYDEASGDLTVEFTDGSEWVYRGVDPKTYALFVTAPSKGRAFNALIRDGFEAEPA